MSAHQQLLYHIVFSTKNRKPYLRDGFRQDVFAYMAGTAKKLKGFALEIDGYYDHAHLLVRIPSKIAVADFVGKVKANSSKHVNQTSGTLSKFGWQEGYGVFTCSLSEKDRLIEYIRNQEEHHRDRTFKEELELLLIRHEVDFDPRYI